MTRLLSLSIAVALLAASAHAQSSVTALLDRAAQLRNAGKPDQALVLLEGAGSSVDSPRLEAELALTLLAVDRPSEAIPRLKNALAMPSHPWLDEHRSALKVALRIAEARLARIEVTTHVIGAEVKVNGLAVGRTPLPGPLEVAEGTAVVVVTAEGFVGATLEVDVRGGGLRTVEVTLDPVPCEERGKERMDTGACCWPGQRFDLASNACTGAPKCPEGFETKAGGCSVPGAAPKKEDPAPTAKEESTRLTGFRMGLRGHMVRFFSGQSARFDAPAIDDRASKGHGFGAQLEVGYRLHRFVSVNVIGSFSLFDLGTRLSEADGAGGTIDVNPFMFTYDAGVLARLHTNKERRLGALDFQLALGFVPFSFFEFHVMRTGADGRMHDRSLLKAFRYPAQLALAVHTDRKLSFDFFGEVSLLTPRSFCGPGGSACLGRDALANEVTWSLGAGLSLLY